MAKNQNNGQEQDLNQILKIRRDKLTKLQEDGKDPSQSERPEDNGQYEILY